MQKRLECSFRLIASAAVLAALAGFNAQATEQESLSHSLFFTADEARQIDAMVSKDTHVAVGRSDIHLGAIMYYGPEDWTLWLQGQQWAPATLHDDLHIIEVQPNQVSLELPALANAPSRKITLHPHQTYHVATGKIIEGATE